MTKRHRIKKSLFIKQLKGLLAYPPALLPAAVLIIAFGAWLAGGFSTLQAESLPDEDRQSAITNVAQPDLAAQDLEADLLWQGEVKPIEVSANTVPVLSKIPTTVPVVFLGIDDGFVKTPEAQKWLIDNKLPFTLFLTNDMIKDNYSYFYELKLTGLSIQNHTLTHQNLSRLTLTAQKAEICGTSELYTSIYGQRPTLFRPPFGEYNNSTIQAVRECGMKAIIMWHAKANGGSMQFQDGTHLQPGDIVLMHFRAEFLQDMNAFINQVRQDNLQIARLEDWVK